MIHRTMSKIVLMLAVAHACLLSAGTFNFKNKTGEKVQIKFMPNKSTLHWVEANGELSTDEKPTGLEIYTRPASPTSPADKWVFEFKRGDYKTIHVKFNGKNLEPQIGGRLSGKTTSGTATKDNITKSSIIKVSQGSTAAKDIVTGTKESVEADIKKNKPVQQKPVTAQPATQQAKPEKPSTAKPTSKKMQSEFTDLESWVAWRQFTKANEYRNKHQYNLPNEQASLFIENDHQKPLALLVLGFNQKDTPNKAQLNNARREAIGKANHYTTKVNPDDNMTIENVRLYMIDWIINPAYDVLSK